MTTFEKFITEWRNRNMATIKTIEQRTPGFKVTVCRTAMIGGGMSYDVRVPVECVPHYDGSRYITICSENRRFVDFVDATMPESHYRMPKGIERYRDYHNHKHAALMAAFNIAATVFPELEKARDREHGMLPAIWVFDLLENETSAEVTVNCRWYSCGCFEVVSEPGRYFDHACATCHRENWTKRQARR